MSAKFVAILGFVLVSIVNGQDNLDRCWSSGNGERARWWENGARIDRGAFYYVCRSGRLEPLGCKTSDGREMPLGSTDTVGDVQMTCALGANRDLEKKVTACVKGGRTYQEGEMWDDYTTNLWYSCKRSANGYYLKIEDEGCIHQSGRVSFGERRIVNGKCLYECQRQYDGPAKMQPVGCVNAEDGGQYSIGDKFPVERNTFTGYCALNDARTECEVMVIGCIHNGEALTDGDRYFVGEMVYQCVVRPTSHQHQVSGCVQISPSGEITERNVNCRWYKPVLGHQLEVTCVRNDDDNTCFVKPEACIFMKDGQETLYLKADTYTIYWSGTGDQGVGCRTIDDKTLQVFEFHPSETLQNTAGLNYEIPRGKK
jgi:hypothetical protein